MKKKWILIVDDEAAILTVLKKSLTKLGEVYQVVTAANGAEALGHLGERHFDLVVTDYKMVGMSGLDLLESIKEIRPETRVIMMTAYGSDELEAEARRLQAFRYLTKPLEIDTFRQIVKEALEDIAISRPGILILSDERYRQVIELLDQLRSDIGARCVFLTDAEGHFIARTGNVDQLPLEQIASLLGGSIATLVEAGRIIDSDTDTINLAYREGQHENLYAINIGPQLLLILIIDQSAYSSRLGSVWFYAQKTVITLRKKLGEAEHASPKQIFDDEVEQTLDAALDSLFMEYDPAEDLSTELDIHPDTFASIAFGSEQSDDSEPETKDNNIGPLGFPMEGDRGSVSPLQFPKSQNLLSFDDAITSGIIPEHFNELNPRNE